jgi:phosphodiesterase/alkaline phosphatase D-like protein
VSDGLTRREAVAGAATGALAMGAPVGVFRRRRRRIAFARRASFPQGVVAGLAGEHELLLWTRLGETVDTVRLGLEVARDPGFANVIHRGTLKTAPKRDHTVRIFVRAKALRPGEEYWYRFFTRDGSSPVGKARMALPADSREPLRVAFFSCQGWQPGYYNAHAAMAKEDLDLAVCLGDYIYEKTDDVGPRTDTIGRERNGFCQTRGEYRQKWQMYRGDPDLRAMHAAHNYIGIPDNHELADDDPGHLDGAPLYVPLQERIRNGLLTYFEYTPLVRDPPAPFRVFRSITLGRQVELLLLEWSPDFKGAHGPGALGNEGQMEWLLGRLENSPATWKVIGSQPMMMSLDLPAGQTLNRGQWDGHVEDRRRIMQHILDRGIRGVTVMSGDIHTFFAGQVTTTGRIDGTPAATEFIGGGITSEPGPEMIFGDDNAAKFAELFRIGANSQNPHYTFSEHLHSGYAVAEFRDSEMLVDFRAVESKMVRPSPSFTLARFRVPVGEPRVEQLS